MDSTDPEEITVALQVADGDLGPFIIDAAGLAVDELSPLAVELGEYRAGSARPSEDLAAVLAEPRANDVAAVVACPSFKLWGRTGGGRVPVSSYALCGRPATHPDLIVAVSPSYESSYCFEILEGVDEAVAWWANAFAAPVEIDPPNLLPPPMELESLFYAMHAIDSFRRVTLEEMLAFETSSEPAVGAEAFSSTMVSSIGSRDLRWLLPAFLHLVPNLAVDGLDIREEHIGFLIDQRLFEAAAIAEDGRGGLCICPCRLLLNLTLKADAVIWRCTCR